MAYVATQTYSEHTYQRSDWGKEKEAIKITQSLQSHFRKYGIYIHFEDIIKRPEGSVHLEKIFLQLEQECGHGNLYVWVPLFFKIPLVGTKVVEWCWIPKIAIQ